MSGNQNSGRKPKYLTVDMFNEFKNNDFWHVKQYAKWSLWVSITVLAAIIARFIIG